jgi:ribosomal protein S18 acetylase RimI-like enzyme
MTVVRELRFRAAVAGDVAAIVALVESAYRGDSSRAGWTTEADLLDGQRTDGEDVSRLIAASGSQIVLMQRDDSLVACAHIERHDHWCYFGMFCVRPSLQGGGVGDAMLRECERIARERWELRQLRMTVIWMREELIDWYRRRGYVTTGERKPFPYGNPRFGLPRRDDLEFIVLAKDL